MGNQSSRSRGMYLVEEGNRAFRCERFQEAIALHLEALPYLEPQSMEMADCLDHLGQDFWRVGEMTQALKFSKNALTIKERAVPNSSSLAKTLSNIGCIFHERGEYEKAYYLLEGALSIRQKIDPESIDVAVTCTNLGLVLMQLNRVQEAIELHQLARRIKQVKAPNSATLARTYVNLANIASAQEQYIKALVLLAKARTIVQNCVTPTPKSLLATIDMNVGNVHFGAGNIDKAIHCYQQAVNREEIVAPDSLILAEMFVELARAYEEKGLLDKARSVRSRALSIRCRKAPSYLEQSVVKPPTEQARSKRCKV
ncbi:hypothetical protein ACA910_021917 [Epithemia clementina (nom. ined.)]